MNEIKNKRALELATRLNKIANLCNELYKELNSVSNFDVAEFLPGILANGKYNIPFNFYDTKKAILDSVVNHKFHVIAHYLENVCEPQMKNHWWAE